MAKKSRAYIKNRTNRRIKKIKPAGKDQRRGIGRRKNERYRYYTNLYLLPVISVTLLIIAAALIYSIYYYK